MRKIRLDDPCLNHLTNIPVGFTRKSSCIHNSEKPHTKNIMCFADRVCVRTWRNLYRYATGYSPQMKIFGAVTEMKDMATRHDAIPYTIDMMQFRH